MQNVSSESLGDSVCDELCKRLSGVLGVGFVLDDGAGGILITRGMCTKSSKDGEVELSELDIRSADNSITVVVTLRVAVPSVTILADSVTNLLRIKAQLERLGMCEKTDAEDPSGRYKLIFYWEILIDTPEQCVGVVESIMSIVRS